MARRFARIPRQYGSGGPNPSFPYALVPDPGGPITLCSTFAHAKETGKAGNGHILPIRGTVTARQRQILREFTTQHATRGFHAGNPDEPETITLIPERYGAICTELRSRFPPDEG